MPIHARTELSRLIPVLLAACVACSRHQAQPALAGQAAASKPPTGQIAYRLALARRYMADVRHALAQVESIAVASPYDRDDPVVQTCLVDELTELKAVANSVDRTWTEMQREIIEKGSDGLEELNHIAVMRQRSLADQNRAERCVAQ